MEGDGCPVDSHDPRAECCVPEPDITAFVVPLDRVDGQGYDGKNRNREDDREEKGKSLPGHLISSVEIDVLYHPPLLGLSEVTVPAGVRWWTKKAKAWSGSLEGVSQGTRRTYAEKAILAYAALVRLGFDVSPQDVTAPMV